MKFPLTSRKNAERTAAMLSEQFGVSLARLDEEKKEFSTQFGKTLDEFKASFSNYIASRANYASFQFQDYTVAKVVQELYLKDPVVSACIGRYQMHYPEPFRLIYEGEKESKDKELIELTRNPNPWMTESKLDRYEITYQLWTGNSYTLIIRDDSGRPFQKFPFSGLNMFPVPSEDKFVSHYNFVTAEGIVSSIEPEDVVHKPWISIDPRRPFMGISPMQLCSRDIQTNIGLTDFMAAYINNLDVPGLIMTRTGKDAEFAIGMEDNKSAKEALSMADGNADDIKAQSKVRFGNDNKGSTAVVDVGWDAKYLGFPLKDIVVEGAYCVPQTNICANFFISPLYVEVESGLRSSTYDNQQTAKLDFYEGTLTGLWTQNCDEETKALKLYYGDDIRIVYDIESVKTIKNHRQKQTTESMRQVDEIAQKYYSGAYPREAAISMAMRVTSADRKDIEPMFVPFTVKPDLSNLTVSPSLNGVNA